MQRIVYLLIITFLVACSNNPSNTANTKQKTISSNKIVAADFPQLNEIDSLDIHFFSNINDLKIYKRIGVSNKASIDSLLVQQLNNASIPQKNCEFNIKYFCFSKNNFIKTIYIATQPNCKYIGYVKSGSVVQLFQINTSALQLLNQLQKQAL